MPRTVPRASSSTARLTHLEDGTEAAAAAAAAPLPFTLTGSLASAPKDCSQILTVLSNDAEAITVPNSGWAQDSLDTAASCAFQSSSTDQELVDSSRCQILIRWSRTACCETEAVEVVGSVCYEIAVCVWDQSRLHCWCSIRLAKLDCSV